MTQRVCLLAALSCLCAWPQGAAVEAVEKALDSGTCAVLDAEKVRACPYSYTADGQAIEAISFRPTSPGRYPAAMLIPGHARTARNQVALGVRLAAEGIAAIAVSQPGYGQSPGPADFVGPKTIRSLIAGYRKFQREPFVDGTRMGIYGFSRGGMAASLMAVELDDLKAAVFGAGVYDFKRAHDEATIPGIAANMRAETGMTEEAIRIRSSVLRMDKLKCPVLILHGEKDANVSVNQALLLRDRLKALNKEFEIRLFPDREHGIGPEVGVMTIDFFKRRL